MRTIKPSVLLCLAGALFSSGCVSSKITMNPPVKAVVVPDTNTASYKIERVKMSTAPYALPLKWKNETFPDRFTRMAQERYPSLFNNSPSSIPILVRIDINQELDSTKSFAVYLCTLCIVGGILPSVPWGTEWQIDIRAEDLRGAPMLSTGVKAEHRGWWSVLTPLGWMEVPGKTDAPVVSSTMFTSGPGQIPVEYKTYAVQCMVDLLAGKLLGQDSTRLPDQSPVLSPPPAATVPLPTETVQPF